MPDTTHSPEDIAVAECSTPIGHMVLAATGTALLYCGFVNTDALRDRLAAAGGHLLDGPAPPQRKVLDQAVEELTAYLTGHRRAFTVPLDLRLATPFSREVNLALAGLVPYGSTTTYAAVAAALNRPRAARSVGAALGANPLCVVLPCHRVVGTSGRLTGYAGGVAAKRYLLDLESGTTGTPPPPIPPPAESGPAPSAPAPKATPSGQRGAAAG